MSLGEILSLVKNAARGAGLAHGLAEDAGKSAAWLVGAGLDDGTAIADALDAAAGRCRREGLCADCAACITAESGPKGGAGSALCLAPLAVDQVCAGETRFELGPIDVPLLVVALAAWRSKRLSFALSLEWPEDAGSVVAICESGAVSIAAADRAAPAAARHRPVSLARLAAEGAAPRGPLAFTAAALAAAQAQAIEEGATLAATAQARILVHAGESYVPASEASRRSGAGAGLVDRD